VQRVSGRELSSLSEGAAKDGLSARGRRWGATPAARAALRRWRWLGWSVLCVPTLAVLWLDWSRRGARLLQFDAFHAATYGAAALESAVVWAALLVAASRRSGKARWVAAVLFVVAGTFAFGGQAYFYEQYNAYLNVDVSMFASNFMDSVVNQLFADIGNYLHAKLPPLVAAVLLVYAARRSIRPRRTAGVWAGRLAPVCLLASFFIPTQHRHQQAATPDMLYLHSVGGLVLTQLGFTEQSNQMRPRVRESLHVAPLVPRREPPRNVLFVILESVRADSACIEHDSSCNKTPFSSRLVPERFPFTNMRALASSTAISLAVLWSGVGPHESRDVLHTWPLLFDYARAAGYDTAFWTSQNMMFGNARLWVKNLGVRRFVSATDLDPTSDLDIGAPEGLLAKHVERELHGLREPFMAVIQLSNVHYPYLVEEDGPQPFQPATTSKAPDVNGSFKNQYQNAVHQQDRHVAAMIRALRATEAGKRTVIVYTSDHGEAFREHNQMGHTFSVFEEEIHVPGWIDAPPGTLTNEEAEALLRKRDAFVSHADIAPTVLDLMGVWDDAKLSRFKSRMIGSSLLRPPVTERPLPLTNCAGVWSCAFENWGYMQGHMKLLARSWNGGWECYDLRTDPGEQHNLQAAGCGNLVQHALTTFGRLPGAKED
jgi:arylsulfatase A-like enzyme